MSSQYFHKTVQFRGFKIQKNTHIFHWKNAYNGKLGNISINVKCNRFNFIIIFISKPLAFFKMLQNSANIINYTYIWVYLICELFPWIWMYTGLDDFFLSGRHSSQNIDVWPFSPKHIRNHERDVLSLKIEII